MSVIPASGYADEARHCLVALPSSLAAVPEEQQADAPQQSQPLEIVLKVYLHTFVFSIWFLHFS